MQASEQPILRDLVLVGGGHSHVVVLRMLAMQPEPGLRITLICTDIDTPYSGMLPGYISGHYSFDDVHIDLGRLAAFAGARFIHGEVTGLDRANQRVLLRDRPSVPYDLLSINTGSTPNVRQVDGARAHTVPVKPIAHFNQRWLQLLDRVRGLHSRFTIAVVGGGAGGVELVLSVQFRLRNELLKLGRNPDLLRFVLLTAGDTILPTHNPGVRARFARVLKERHVAVHTRAEVTEVSPGCLHTQDGRTFDADETLWVTQAGGPVWLQSTGLALDEHGFIQVNQQLQTLDDPKIFAVGDVASFTARPLEKAGVFAVRMGPPLAKNLRLSLRGQPLVAYNPQQRWLALISTGDRYAVASRGALGFAGAWVWTWKDWIDRRFMRKFTELPAMADASPAAATPTSSLVLSAEESRQAISAIAMRCGGCGAKVGASILTRALGSLQPVERDDVLIGLHAPDDAAVVRVPPGKAMVHTVDFFRSFIDDPYLFGQVAANHALGDIFAMGAEPQSATAIATVPPGLEAKVEDLLLQMMTGAVEVLNAAGCALVGGHTGEGRELALGFAINGLIDEQMDGVMRKGGMLPGDVLLLTKPIGTGTLFAAHARYAAKGRWIDAALKSMVVSNQAGAQILRAHGATACTDLTGFGLLGHLVEMTRPSGVDAELQLSALPLLDGAVECVEAGIVSSLQPANVRLRRALRNAEDFVKDPRYPLLFDPQTAGGLLASVPADRATDCIRALKAAGYPQTAAIGRIRGASDVLEPVVLTA
ncbi:MAG TPA: selenide, water dikinase SelD [Hydrogenophaga sp.]|uniref:selenide, water dikinase SelD n=1 Tax=Hydrogenophaga sp. TaxID=1904254 RepID=UPI0008C7D3A9|nr:selenide, water dikinase SelD [Hydrogenophaga sp.]OGA75139.1 MAG: selenide, water dikinase SelD [Burkholderiales bacterium GWE1_65_30]OGA93274.1 MAG: selenide, water dikinase SelD [Burkholderiales bacterium GWF1_66_17]HAX20905.1 selenide, water dikinase SelD [Hydrogenophaga sp.]HBU17371.1 selenide, water dikinase SelD [Hydrogenophaga sp.]